MVFGKVDPRLLECVTKASDLAFCEGEIPIKYKLLIAMALDAAHGASKGVRSLAEQAMRAGFSAMISRLGWQKMWVVCAWQMHEGADTVNSKWAPNQSLVQNEVPGLADVRSCKAEPRAKSFYL